MRLFYFLLVIYCLPIQAQQISKITAEYDSVRSTIPREKIYVHFDKSTYVLPDTIWFKAYLVDAALNKYSAHSGLIYIELINNNEEIIQSVSLPTIMGLTWGGFPLSSQRITPGVYYIRAYTNWMRNFGDTHFYQKEFRILSTNNEDVPVLSVKETGAIQTKLDRSSKKDPQDIDVQFLPEGGNLVMGLPQKIAFKAINKNGKGVLVEGNILNSKKVKLAQFSSNELGMGYVYLPSAVEESYEAEIVHQNTIRTIPLPKPLKNGTVLHVTNSYSKDSIEVNIYTTLANQEITLIGQSRGVQYFFTQQKLNSKSKNIKIAKSVFPTGVCQILLVDQYQKTINERNFFIHHHDQLNIELSTSTSTYKTRDSIPIHLSALNSLGHPIEGSFSLVVTDDNQVTKDSIHSENILSFLLMQSDLIGEIEKPGYYFHEINAKKHHDLDALMLTQGWVNYNWNLHRKNDFKIEKDFNITGRITNLLNIPIAKAKVTMLGRNKGFLLIDTIANDRGEFIFNQLPILDSATLIIQALNTKEKRGTLGILLDEFKPPSIKLSSNHMFTLNNELDSIVQNFVKTKKEAKELPSVDGILLQEVSIKGKKTIKGSKNLNGSGGSDQLIVEEELNKLAKKTLFDILQDRVSGFKIAYRRTSKTTFERDYFIKSKRLKIIIDGVYLDFFYYGDNYYNFVKEYLDFYNAEDIRGIEVMSSYKNGYTYKAKYTHMSDLSEYAFLEITTKNGSGPFLRKHANIYIYRPMNYGNSKVFYSPKYPSSKKEIKTHDLRSTIYWHPNLITNANGKANVSFYATDKKGTYTVWIEGTDLHGNFGFKTMKINIQ